MKYEQVVLCDANNLDLGPFLHVAVTMPEGR